MNVRILIIQEVLDTCPDDTTYLSYNTFCDLLGYESYICREENKLTEVIEIRSPEIICWIYPRSSKINKILQEFRGGSKNIPVIWADDQRAHPGYIVGHPSDYYDHFMHVIVTPQELQKTIEALLSHS